MRFSFQSVIKHIGIPSKNCQKYLQSVIFFIWKLKLKKQNFLNLIRQVELLLVRCNKMKSILFLINFIYLSANAFEYNCDYQQIEKVCEQIKPDNNGIVKPYYFDPNSNDPNKVGNRFPEGQDIDEANASKNFEKNYPNGYVNSKDSKRFQEFSKLFESVKEHLKETVKEKYSDSKPLPPEVQNLINQIDSAKMDDMAKNSENRKYCMNEKDYGYYGANANSKVFFLCPTSFNYPNESLVFIMGAFLARSTLGLCAKQLNTKFYKKNPIEFIVEKSEITVNKGQNIVQCLNKQSPKTVIDYKPSEITEEQLKSFKLRYNLKDTDMPFVKDNTKDLSSCYTELTHHKIDSSIQDYFGGVVLSKYLDSQKENPKFNDLSDEDKYRTKFVKPLAAMIDFNCRFGDSAKQLNKDMHGTPEERFKILFSNPDLVKSLGCKMPQNESSMCRFNKAPPVNLNEGTQLKSGSTNPDGLNPHTSSGAK